LRNRARCRVANRDAGACGADARNSASPTGKAPGAVFGLGVPVLGICYGMQTMAQQLGGRVEAGKVREFGYAEVRARGHTKLLDGIEDYRTGDDWAEQRAASDFVDASNRVRTCRPGFLLVAQGTSQ
jgi:GMP synthase (glutamine-hydrolysing)